jgi:hypothetical protein
MLSSVFRVPAVQSLVVKRRQRQPAWTRCTRTDGDPAIASAPTISVNPYRSRPRRGSSIAPSHLLVRSFSPYSHSSDLPFARHHSAFPDLLPTVPLHPEPFTLPFRTHNKTSLLSSFSSVILTPTHRNGRPRLGAACIQHHHPYRASRKRASPRLRSLCCVSFKAPFALSRSPRETRRPRGHPGFPAGT